MASGTRYQLVLSLALVSAVLLQYFVIAPIEQSLVQDSITDLASLVYLPHGVSVICALLAGKTAFLPILLANSLGYLLYGLLFLPAMVVGLMTTLCIFVPLALYNYLRERPLVAPVINATDEQINLFRSTLVFAFVASLIDGMARATLHAEQGFDLLALRFVFGDMMGTFLTLVLLLVLKKAFIAVGRYLHE